MTTGLWRSRSSPAGSSVFLGQKVRSRGNFWTRKVTLDVIPYEGHKPLYGWLKATADSLLAASGQGRHLTVCPAGLHGDPASVPRRSGGRSVRYGHLTSLSRKTADNDARGSLQNATGPARSDCGKRTLWVSECGLRFRKATGGAATGSGVWSANRLDLKSIREIKSGE